MKISKINIRKQKKQEKAEETSKPEKGETHESVLASIEISEATARRVWAGEIAIASAVALISVIIAFIG